MQRYRTRLNKPAITPQAITALSQALQGPLSGNYQFAQRCEERLERSTGAAKCLLTPSGTDALELAALLLKLRPGDEVIMPSFTFASTANAFALRGAVPVFVDIRPDTLNINEKLVAGAITKRTRAICPVHYAGVSCAMRELSAIAKRHKLAIVEDAAQAVGATYYGKSLGAIGDFGAYSFHDSKVLTAGEGGALLIKNQRYVPSAEILWEKGTNRAQLVRGEIDKYTWVDIGSSFLMSELGAALLWSQLEAATQLIKQRRKLWQNYHTALQPLEQADRLRRPIVPDACKHNGHIYYILLRNLKEREALRQHLKREGIEACFHYVPLHSAPAGKRFGRIATPMTVTNRTASSLLRLPIYPDLPSKEQTRIVKVLKGFWR